MCSILLIGTGYVGDLICMSAVMYVHEVCKYKCEQKLDLLQQNQNECVLLQSVVK
jgi:hypothetical protein